MSPARICTPTRQIEILFILLLLLMPLLAACDTDRQAGTNHDDVAGTVPASGTAHDRGGSSERLHLVVTFSVLGDMVSTVAGDAATVDTIVGPGIDTHTFEPSPAESRKLADADLVFENGLGFESWLDDLYESSGSEARRVALAEGLKNLIRADEELSEEGEHSADEQEHGEYDPHVWGDVTNVVQEVEVVRDTLAEVDPVNAATYKSNSERYIADLQDLDQYIREQSSTLPEDRRTLVTTHDTLGYFARRYGFEIAVTALGISTEAGEPSAAKVAQLIQEIRAASVPAIFVDTVSNSRTMERVGSETGAVLAPPLYTDALGKPGSEGDTYIGMMRYNIDTIVDALSK